MNIYKSFIMTVAGVLVKEHKQDKWKESQSSKLLLR